MLGKFRFQKSTGVSLPLRILDSRALKPQTHRHYFPFLEWLRCVLLAGLFIAIIYVNGFHGNGFLYATAVVRRALITRPGTTPFGDVRCRCVIATQKPFKRICPLALATHVSFQQSTECRSLMKISGVLPTDATPSSFGADVNPKTSAKPQ